MSLFRYFSPSSSLPSSSSSLPSLTPEAVREANKRVACLAKEAEGAGPGAEAAENESLQLLPNGLAKAICHFLSVSHHLILHNSKN